MEPPTTTENTSTVTTAETVTAPDVITALLPPVSPTYQNQLDQWVKDFQTAYPNITLRIDKTSWEDMSGKLDVQLQAGSPPDIAFAGGDGISRYLETGRLTDISKYMTASMISDYDIIALDYFKNGKGLYGLPAYMDVQAIGGDKTKLEEAGIDWKSIQQNG